MKRDKALSIACMTRHQYYYQPQGKRRGRAPSGTTLLLKGVDVERVPNEQVVSYIETIQQDPDTDYGYRKITYALMILGYLINHKKVYRLMNEHQLLKDHHQKCPRTYVRYRKVLPTEPLCVLEMDIKMV